MCTDNVSRPSGLIAAALGARPGESLEDAARRVVAERDGARQEWSRTQQEAKRVMKSLIAVQTRLQRERDEARRWAARWKDAAHEARRWERIARDELASVNALAERDAQAAFAVREEAARLRAEEAAARAYIDFLHADDDQGIDRRSLNMFKHTREAFAELRAAYRLVRENAE